MDLPKRTNSMKTGTKAASLLHSALSEVANVTTISQEADLGIDFNCDVIDRKGFPTGQTFFVQCKGSENLPDQSHEEISVQIKTSTINYWLKQKSPVFLIYVDRMSGLFYWTVPHHQILNKLDLDKVLKNKSVVIKIDKKNHFSIDLKSLPSSFLEEIDNFDYKETQFEFNNSISKTAIKVEYNELQLPKNDERKNLIKTDDLSLCYRYVSQVRDLFERHYIVSSISNWNNFGNQFQFYLYNKINSASFYYVATVVISFRIDSPNVIDYVIELPDKNKTWIAGGENDLEHRIEDIDTKIKKIHTMF